MKLHKNTKDITGLVFGRLTVLRPANRPKKCFQRSQFWLCECTCGSKHVTAGTYLRKGECKSCGCLEQENLKSFTKHGLSRSKVYHTWQQIKERCNNPKQNFYHCYGGRGIKVCKKWLDFEVFLKDMGLPPSANAQIDRIDNDRNYEKSNCRWVTPKENSRNKRTNLMISFNGITQCARAWDEQLLFQKNCVAKRLERGWSIERALTERPLPRQKRVA